MFPEKVLGKADPAQNHHCRGAMLRRWLGNGTAGLSRAMNADAKLAFIAHLNVMRLDQK